MPCPPAPSPPVAATGPAHRYGPTAPRRLLRLWAVGLGLALGWAGMAVAQARAEPARPATTTPTTAAAGTADSTDLAAGNLRLQQAREALRRRDGPALAAARDALAAQGHPLAQWADYWELTHRLDRAQQPELDAFWLRWPGTYVEDRLRNDWLLELGKRGDWDHFRAEFPRFRLNDDRSLHCWALLVRHLDGEDVKAPALAAWLAQRDADAACTQMARALMDAGVFTATEAWLEARRAVEAGRQRAAHAAVELAHAAAGPRLTELWANPSRFLQRTPAAGAATQRELALLALLRLAAVDPAAAAQQLDAGWQQRLPAPEAALAWAVTTKQAALRLQPEAAEHARRAWRQARRTQAEVPWTDDLLAWQVRAALRLPDTAPDRWALVEQAIAAMSPAAQADPAWVYWRAQALLSRARPGREGETLRTQARQLLDGIADPLHFYGQLALETLDRPLQLPGAPRPLTLEETAAVRGHPGLGRALQLFALGLRSEAVREWNFSIRGLPERELLAAAQWACEREVWDRCINTSERTRAEVDIAQRYPTPMRAEVLATAARVGVDPALKYGLIRQESRFILNARSHVGASGLMQVMPATARYTARRIGMPFEPGMLNDRDVNLRLGASYLKIVLDDFGGHQALAAAAYNAGPGRPRRWREGGTWDAAAWAETVPFAETRDYVQKVLANAVVYSAVLGTVPPPELSLRARLGATVGPREASAPAADRTIP